MRLWTHGWDIAVPTRCPARRCYDTRHRADELAEDRRRGTTLYARPEVGRPPPGEARRRAALSLASQRRVLQLVGAPDEDSAEAVRLGPRWGAGSVRAVGSFADHAGIDFSRRELTARARRGSIPPEMLDDALGGSLRLPGVREGVPEWETSY